MISYTVFSNGKEFNIVCEKVNKYNDRYHFTIGNEIVADFSNECSYFINREDSKLAFLVSVVREMKRQDKKFGADRILPSVNKERFHGLVSEADAKQLCEIAMSKGTETWADIAVEEMAEAVYANSEANRKDELIQLIAVLCQWVKNIERKEK